MAFVVQFKHLNAGIQLLRARFDNVTEEKRR